MSNPTAVCETTMGSFTIELYTDKMPITAYNFIDLVLNDFVHDFVIMMMFRQKMAITMDCISIVWFLTSWINLDALIQEIQQATEQEQVVLSLVLRTTFQASELRHEIEKVALKTSFVSKVIIIENIQTAYNVECRLSTNQQWAWYTINGQHWSTKLWRKSILHQHRAQ